MNQKILIGVAWPYVNGDLHLGHLAGYLLPADITARYQRLRGNDVLMVSGSDCHGTPITVESDKTKLSPAEIVAKYHAQDLALFKQYHLSYNIYTLTTTENHVKVVQEMFLELLKNGYIVKGVMKQYYSEADQRFLPDRYVEGTCPHCGAREQRSDQCENCGRWLADGELLEPRSKLTQAPVTLKDTEHYFLDFEKLSPELRTYVDSRKDIWRRWVWQEADSWLKEGLKKRAITRDMDWAVPLPVEELKKLPEDLQLTDYTGKNIYVWFEAVIGYLSGAIEWSLLSSSENLPGKDVIFQRTAGQGKDWQDWWLNPEARMFNFMGQDNLVFHTLMWPGQLIGTKKGYHLPDDVVVNKFMNLEGKKFSKSRNWSIDSKMMADRYGTDPVRYYLAANFPENKEGDFTWQGFVAGVNNELVANLGNYVNRSLKFFESKYQGKLELPGWQIEPEVNAAIANAFIEVARHLDRVEQVSALDELLKLCRFGNKYFDEHKLWEIVNTDPDQAKVTMLQILNLVKAIEILMQPFLPEAGTKLKELLLCANNKLDFTPEVGKDLWLFEPTSNFSLGGPVSILFNKLDPAKVFTEKDRQL